MSIYISKLATPEGIDWPQVGAWQRGIGVNRLETLAKNLDVSDTSRTDLLNSVPTPWARLLLFEAALYDEQHPAHAEVVSQWRGLLGTVALHGLLRLRFDQPRHVDLRQLPGRSEIRDAFKVLRPPGTSAAGGEWDDEWTQFSLVSVEGSVIGATSPRTLLFSGISHNCPESIPFRSPEGRLSDPLKYYKRFGDELFVGLLAQWLDGLIERVNGSESLRELLGTIPMAHGRTISRHDRLVEALTDWRDEFEAASPARVRWPPAQSSPFQGPYSVLRSIPAPPGSPHLNQSDLFLRGRRDMIVCFRRGQGSTLVDRHGAEVNDDRVRLSDGHWMEAAERLPDPLNFLPPVKVIEDPAAFFETSLIQAPLNPDASYSLQFEGKHYLLPYREAILDYFSPEEIVRNTSLQRTRPNHITVELNIPVVNNRAVRASFDYREDDDVLTPDKDKFSADSLAFWPDFICDDGSGRHDGRHWSRYFYYKFSAGQQPQLDFTPLGANPAERSLPLRHWFETSVPLEGFVGEVDGRRGLLLIKYERLDPPNHNWKVAVDLGSTHTRAFYLEVARQGEQWLGINGNIRPLKFTARVRELTECAEIDLLENFFPLERTVGAPAAEEFTSQLVLPQPNNEDHPDWLPREGLIYRHSLLDGFPSNTFKHNFKWNSDVSDYALRAFLRCLLVLVQAEALREGAKVVSISHSYPSVFTPGLVMKHTNEWIGLGIYSGLIVEPPLMEAEAVGRHLQVGQGASVADNTIALDVGGSTTDIAIWSSNSLARQESVKMAAGVIGRYVQTESGAFKQALVRTLAGQPFKMTIDLDEFKDEEAGFSLMFNATLNAASVKGQLGQLVTSIKNSPEGKVVIAHIMFVFGALLYYAGMLGRKAGMGVQSPYFVYFCGKGGQFITWVNNHERFAAEMFAAGLHGPHHAGQSAVSVNTVLSKAPKQEVGRGLLAESSLKATRAGDEGGLVSLDPPTVTVGEEGYKGLQWAGELDGRALTSLPQEVPDFAALEELTNFVRAFVRSASTKEAARLLGVGESEPAHFRARLKERLFGAARGRIVYDLQNHADNALLESLFITEVKVLLETATDNHHLFSETVS